MDQTPEGRLETPSVELSLADLDGLLGVEMPRDKDRLNEILAFVKGDVESIDEQSGAVSVEIKDSNHPDLWCVEGIARALRSFLGTARRKPLSVAGRSGMRVVVDKRVKPIRPYIACAVVKRVRASEEALKSWISLQDKMDQTYGRKRRKASIGLYQADLVSSPLRYTVSSPEAASFVPLGSYDKMSLAEILERHPKGVEYGAIVSSFKEWPLLVDGEDKVLSFPPIINSNDLGRITTETRNILVEVTGTNLDSVHDTLKIVVTTLAERGGRVYSCVQKYPYGSSRRIVTPDLESNFTRLSLNSTNRVLGTSLTAKEASRYLERAGYQARQAGQDRLEVEIPCYRLDIMHPIDLVEDIAIAMDLNKLKPEWPRIWTVGRLATQSERLESVAEVMVGLGYQELLTYSLTSPEVIAKRMNIDRDQWVELMNPKMSTHTVLRNWLLPSLLEVLSNNTHVDYPQRVFEIGPCIVPRLDQTSRIEDLHKLAVVTIHAGAGFTEIRACLDALLTNIGVEFNIESRKHPSFLEGRCGAIISGEAEIGVIGELHPYVIRSWGLSLPAAAFELDLRLFEGPSPSL